MRQIPITAALAAFFVFAVAVPANTAELTCSTAEVEQDIKARMADPMCHVSNAFDAPICDLESKCENVRSVVSDAKGKLFLLERDYKTELDAAYRSQDEACEQMKTAYEI